MPNHWLDLFWTPSRPSHCSPTHWLLVPSSHTACAAYSSCLQTQKWSRWAKGSHMNILKYVLIDKRDNVSVKRTVKKNGHHLLSYRLTERERARWTSHLAEECHSVRVPCICSLGEVVIRPLLDRKHQKHISSTNDNHRNTMLQSHLWK